MFLALTTFVVMLAVSFACVLLFTRPSKVEQAIDSRLSEIHVTQAGALGEGTPAIFRQTRLSELDWLDAILQRLPLAHRAEDLLLQGGATWSVGQVLLASCLSGVAGYLLGIWFLPFRTIALVTALFGCSLPFLFIRAKKESRVRKFEKVLPDTIDIIARSLRAGHAVSAALEIVGEHGPEPARSEFRTACRQQNLGLPFRESLLKMLDRVPSTDLQLVVTSMLVQKETGGNLIEILDRTGHVIRERIRLHGQVRVYTAQGRLTAWILGALPVFLYLMLRLVNPSYMKVMTTDAFGQKLLAVGMVQVLLGFLIIRKIVKVKV